MTFSLVDPNGDQGFPGQVNTTIVYTVSSTSCVPWPSLTFLQLEAKATWKITMESTASELTPIMLSCHQYWNLEAYQETQDLVGHFAEFEASKIVSTNGLLIPNGQTTPVQGTPLGMYCNPRFFSS